MIPRAFTDLFNACNQAIVSCESCINVARACEKACANTMTCPAGAQDFIAQSHATIAACEACIKVCDEMIVQFKKDGHDEHMEALNTCVKVLGECVRICKEGIDKCSALNDCSTGCSDARDACEDAIMAADACIESCEKHSIFYRTFKKY